MFFDQQYMQLCSEKTLQTNKEGFFLQFADAVAENVGGKWIKHFGKLKTDKERLRKVYQDDKIKESLFGFLENVQEVYRKKCVKTAKTRLVEADTVYKSGDHKKALNYYSQSVLKAPTSDPTFSLALLKRAKVLISLNEFSTALTDIQLSLKEKVPENHKFEAFWMMAVCYKALNEEAKAKVSLNLAEKLIGENTKLLGMLHQSMQTVYQPNKKNTKELPKITHCHPQMTSACKKITQKTSPELGRYVVASDSIKTGETLVVESPIVACLFPEKFGTHCHHCFERILAPVGCPDCVSVVFCNAICRDAAVPYHRFECKYLDLLIGSGMSVLSLAALRSITQKSQKECLEIYKNKGYLYGLCTNWNKRPAGDFLQRTLMAAFLLSCLQKSGYFQRGGTVVPTEDEYKVGEMLLHHLQVLQFNAHEIYETLYTAERKVKGGRPAYIGVGLYPTVARFNHDCYPAVTRHFVGKHIVITSTRPLPPGALIAENYGPIFTHRKLIDRQRSLSARYWFNCRCNSCLEDWPTLNESTLNKRVRCTSFDCSSLFTLPLAKEQHCSKCGKNVSLEEQEEKLKWCEEQYEEGNKLLEDGNVEKAVGVLCDAFDVFHRVSVPPHKETHLAEENLKACFANLGNTAECLVKKEK